MLYLNSLNGQAVRLELFELGPLRPLFMKQCICYLQTSRKPMIVTRKVLHTILNEFGITMKLVRLIQMCLNEAVSRVRVRKHLSDVFPIKNGLKQGHALSPLPFNFAF
jgi:hypothetical protein